MRLLAALLVVGASGCSKATKVADAGTRVHRSTDLKTAVFSAYPEFRGARVMQGFAELSRVVDQQVPVDGAVLETVTKNGFAVTVDGGTLVATRAPYTLRIEDKTLALSIPITEEDIGKLLNAPLTMTTEQLALWYPKLPKARITDETFHVRLIYDSIAWRAGYLAWQMVELNTQGSWRLQHVPDGYALKREADGGGGASPLAYDLTLIDSNTQARIDVKRDGGFVQLDYRLRTEEYW